MVTESCTYHPTPVPRSADSRPPPSLPEALRGLLRPSAYPHAVERVDLIATHMSWVLLTGEFAYKVKRPVRFAFADFSSPVHRAELCAEEIRLNRRFAPGLYLGVVAVREDESGQARIGGTGPMLESAVQMRQFDRRDELDQRVAAGTVGAAEFAAFGTALAAIHAALPPLLPPPQQDPHQDPRQDPQQPPHRARQPTALPQPLPQTAPTAHILRRNYAELLRLASATRGADQALPTAALRALRHALARALRTARPALAARTAAGAIRECHGDLHLANLVLLDGRITAFDALEFEPAFRRIDVADEVAFLCADLLGHDAPQLARAFLEAYVEASGDHRLFEVLDLYLAHRALVRAKIMAIRLTAASTGEGAADPAALARFKAYVDIAARALRAPGERPPPRLVLMHGLSGSGKTWLARQVAARLGAIHLRSDVERKRLGGLAPLDPSGSAPGAGLYGAAASQRTYARLATLARTVLGSGRSVVCDAAFLERRSRDVLRDTASDSGATVTLVRCHAPTEELRRRLRARRAAGSDPSEADESILDWQLLHAEPLQPDELAAAVVDIDTTRADAVDAACRAIAANAASDPLAVS